MIPFARTHIRNCRPVFTLSRTSGSKKCNNVAQSTANESNKIEKINRVAIASLGVFSGCIGSMVGMGGAFVALPFLTGYFAIPHSLAHGTAITAVVATSLGGIISYAQKKTDKSDSVDKENNSLGIPKRIGHIDTLHTLCISVSSSCTVIIGAMISKRMSNRNLKLAMGGLMMLMAPSIYAKDYLSKAFTESIDPMLASAKESTAAISSSTVGSISKEVASTQEDLIREIIPPIVIGGVTGIMSGVFGIGGGAIVVPALCVFTDMEYQTALGTSLASMFPTSIVGTVTHYLQKSMLVYLAIPLASGCILGSFIGGAYGKYVGENSLKAMFASVLTVLGARNIYFALKMVK